jgi:hypothetical protein
MTITEIRKKVKKINSLLSQYNMLVALDKAIIKTKKQGLENDPVYHSNIKKTIHQIENQFNNILNQSSDIIK